MSDMGPRRMDGAAVGPRTAAGSVQRPAQPRPAGLSGGGMRASQPVRRPMQPGASQIQRPAAGQPRNAVGPQPVADVPAAAPSAQPTKSGGTLGVVIQFVVGILIIIGVAAAVVWLWVKYYQ